MTPSAHAASHTPHKPQHHPGHTTKPDDFEPGLLPIDPDQGPVPALDPMNPQEDRPVDPEA